MKAEEFLAQALETLAQRGKDYDSPQGERSMLKAVTAFNAITGQELSEAEGWLFMEQIKIARQYQAPGYHHDSALDGVAYAALRAEALSSED